MTPFERILRQFPSGDDGSLEDLQGPEVPVLGQPGTVVTPPGINMSPVPPGPNETPNYPPVPGMGIRG
jgi:hypothetical protein